jgi:hypothetical protein
MPRTARVAPADYVYDVLQQGMARRTPFPPPADDQEVAEIRCAGRNETADRSAPTPTLDGQEFGGTGFQPVWHHGQSLGRGDLCRLKG